MELFNPGTGAKALRARLASDNGQRVVCYCAGWCRTCDAYQPLLRTLAAELPAWTFIWVDIETHPEWLGDQEIENFPTLLIQDALGTRFWGPQPPYAEVLRRLIEGAGKLPIVPAGPGQVDALMVGMPHQR